MLIAPPCPPPLLVNIESSTRMIDESLAYSAPAAELLQATKVELTMEALESAKAMAALPC